MENDPAPTRMTGVVLMTYGSATTSERVGEYMAHIYRGAPPEGIVEDFMERYRLVGKSPLVEITREQARLVEAALEGRGGERYVVRAGMLHSQPYIAEAVEACRGAGAERCIGIILSPQFSSFIMDGYRSALEKAASADGFPKEGIAVAGPWPTEKHFIQLLGERVKTEEAALSKRYGRHIPVVFTTHSLPKRVVEKDPGYLEQLRSTIDAAAKYINDPSLEWRAAYQSAGHTPEEWLKPDLTDVLADLKKEKTPAVLIAPIQFLADHLEILYDLDIAARKQCEAAGIAYHRIELPNTDPLFIKCLARVVYNTKI